MDTYTFFIKSESAFRQCHYMISHKSKCPSAIQTHCVSKRDRDVIDCNLKKDY